MDERVDSEHDDGNETSLHFIDTAQIVSAAIFVILQNVLLLLLTLLHWLSTHVYSVLQWVLLYIPLVTESIQWVAFTLFSFTTYTDDVILSLSETLYQTINTTLDTLEGMTVQLHSVLPYCAAIPIQVLHILLDWSKLLCSLVTVLLPSTLYTSQTLTYLTELNYAIYDLSKISWVVITSVLEQGTDFIFSAVISLITSAKYITYITIRVLQISCCQILPTMVTTTWTSLTLVFTNLINIPQQLIFNCLVFLDYYQLEIDNIKLILQLSIQLILSLLQYTYYYTSQILLFIFQPLLALVEFTVYLVHAAFSSVVPGGLVTILIGLIALWRWYYPTNPAPPNPPNTLQLTPPTPDPVTPEEELKEALDSEREQKLCVICTDNVKCTVLLPCRHCCLCVECTAKLRVTTQPLCPLCRKQIDSVLEIYL